MIVRLACLKWADHALPPIISTISFMIHGRLDGQEGLFWEHVYRAEPPFLEQV
jgi:hypothetical protein